MKPVPVRTVLVPLLEPQGASHASPPRGVALFRLGFRPFYLLAALFAALAVPLWLAQFAGVLPPPAAYPAMLWHAHEMSFGFVLAVIVGFLLTAARVWTGLPTPTGRHLAGLAALWVVARLFNYFGPSPAAMLADAAFLILPMIALGLVLVKAQPSVRAGDTHRVPGREHAVPPRGGRAGAVRTHHGRALLRHRDHADRRIGGRVIRRSPPTHCAACASTAAAGSRWRWQAPGSRC